MRTRHPQPTLDSEVTLKDDEPEIHPKRLAAPNVRAPKVVDKDLNKMIKAAHDAGWWCEKRPSNYVFCWHPNGSDFVRVVSTPKKQSTIRNIRAEFKRKGLRT